MSHESQWGGSGVSSLVLGGAQFGQWQDHWEWRTRFHGTPTGDTPMRVAQRLADEARFLGPNGVSQRFPDSGFHKAKKSAKQFTTFENCFCLGFEE